MVYANEGLRGTLTPQVPHISTLVVIAALAAIDLSPLVIGVRFHGKAIG
jgi:hypothetical protein